LKPLFSAPDDFIQYTEVTARKKALSRLRKQKPGKTMSPGSVCHSAKTIA